MSCPRLLLCSHFTGIAPALGEEFHDKRVVFIPTAAAHEEYTGYVASARSSWKDLGAEIVDLDIVGVSRQAATEVLEQAEVIYLSGGNSFFLLDQLRSTGIDRIIKACLAEGAVLVGESAGAIVCSPDLSYIQPMDPVPDSYSQTDYIGLGLVDFFPVPHYLNPPFVESSHQVVNLNPRLPLKPISNTQALLVEGTTLIKV